jgi:hypothetical protein
VWSWLAFNGVLFRDSGSNNHRKQTIVSQFRDGVKLFLSPSHRSLQWSNALMTRPLSSKGHQGFGEGRPYSLIGTCYIKCMAKHLTTSQLINNYEDLASTSINSDLERRRKCFRHEIQNAQ